MRIRRRSAIMVEYLVIATVFMMLVWVVAWVLMYIGANNTIDTAAKEGARVVSAELRGFEGKITDLPSDQKDVLISKFIDKTAEVSGFNGNVLLYRDENRQPLSESDIKTLINEYLEDEAGCLSALDDNTKKRVICLYTKNNAVNGRDHQEITVKLKSNMKVTGSFIPGLTERTFVYANSSSMKDLAGRFQYHYTN